MNYSKTLENYYNQLATGAMGLDELELARFLRELRTFETAQDAIEELTDWLPEEEDLKRQCC